MARKKSLVIEILGNNKMGRAVRDAMGSLRSLGRFAAGIGRGIARAFKFAAVGIGAMVGALAYAAKQYAEQEQADIDLAAAIRKRGDAVDEMLPKLQAEALAIQKETKYGDELIQSLQAQAINMGITSDGATDATKAALGLAKAYGLEVVSAMRLVTRARVGDTATLKRYGIILDDTLDAEQKYQSILKIGRSNYGLVQEEVKTLSGRFSQFKNAIGDVVQAFGGAFVEGVNLEDLFARMSKKALTVAETLKDKLQPQFEKFRDVVEGLFAGGKDRSEALNQLKGQWQKALDFVGPKLEEWGEAAGAAIWRGFKSGGYKAVDKLSQADPIMQARKAPPLALLNAQMAAMGGWRGSKGQGIGTRMAAPYKAAGRNLMDTYSNEIGWVQGLLGRNKVDSRTVSQPGASPSQPLHVQEVKPLTAIGN